MENLYKDLGFEHPKCLVNHCGIKIYIGTKGKDDWCISIPKELLKKVKRIDYHKKEMVMYFISESEALKIAKEFTI